MRGVLAVVLLLGGCPERGQEAAVRKPEPTPHPAHQHPHLHPHEWGGHHHHPHPHPHLAGPDGHHHPY